LFVRKLRYTLHDNEWSDSHGYAAYRGESTLLTGLGSVSRFGVLIALAAFGAAVAWPQRRNWWPVAVLAALLALATAVFFVFGRYRLVLVPLLVPLAAVACVDLASLPHFDRRRWIGCAAAVVLAASALGRTVVKDQSVSDTWVNAAGALCARDRAEQAREALEQVLALDTRRVDARIRLGHALACTSRWSEAEAEVQRALLLDASWRAPAAFELGLAAGRGGDLVRAAYWLQRAVDADDESPRAWERLGVALRGIGKLVQAERALRRAHELDPTDPDTLNNLGYLLEQSGRHGDAREAYDRALALDPDHAHARQNAARMHAP